MSFIQDCISGKAEAKDIDNYISEWHEEPTDLEIYEYLGITNDEYSRFVQDEFSLIQTIHDYIQESREI